MYGRKRLNRTKPYKKTLHRGISPEGSTDEGMHGKGTYYTANKNYAENYARTNKGRTGKVLTHKIKLKKPLIITHGNAKLDNIRSKSMVESKGKPYKERQEIASRDIRKKVEKQGYDGIVLRWSGKGKQDEVVVFHPKRARYNAIKRK